MASGTESEVEVDEAQGEASGSCSMSTTSGVGKEKRRSKVGIDCVECAECGKTIKTKTGNTTNLMLDPWFKEVSFSASANRTNCSLIITLMRRVNTDEANSSTDNEMCVISDNENVHVGSAEKKNLW